MLSCSIRFSAPSLWMGGGLESRCVGHVYGADGAVRLVLSSTLEGSSCTDIMTCTGGCGYSF